MSGPPLTDASRTTQPDCRRHLAVGRQQPVHQLLVVERLPDEIDRHQDDEQQGDDRHVGDGQAPHRGDQAGDPPGRRRLRHRSLPRSAAVAHRPVGGRLLARVADVLVVAGVAQSKARRITTRRITAGRRAASAAAASGSGIDPHAPTAATGRAELARRRARPASSRPASRDGSPARSGGCRGRCRCPGISRSALAAFPVAALTAVGVVVLAGIGPARFEMAVEHWFR